jgi:SagB-type dehydrogenase family enzyme
VSGSNLNLIIKLPAPIHDSKVSLEKAMLDRRCVRTYGEVPLALAEISQLLWAAQGVTDPRGFRTSPSAGALYPLEIYVVTGKTDDLPAGIYKYIPSDHGLQKRTEGDKRAALCRGSRGHAAVKNAPAVLVFCAVYERVTSKYGDRGTRYTHIEAGHAAQNVCLQAVSLGLNTVVIGAFDDKDIKRTAKLEADESPLYLMPVGKD